MSSVETDVVKHVAEFDGTGRRVSKVVTNAGDLDGTEVYYHSNKWQVIEVRDGSANVLQQIYHGTQYIDEVVAERLPKGVAFVHQDANWNVIALTDFAGQVLERYDYTPYGTATIDQETMFGDSDGDSFVTEAEWDTDTDGLLDSDDDCWGSDPADECRLVDLDFDGVVDGDDATLLAGLDSGGTYRAAGLHSSSVGNTRAHQGLILLSDLIIYSNRARLITSGQQRWLQRDQLSLTPLAESGYQDGLNLYEYLLANPLANLDPMGSAFCNVVGNLARTWIKCVCRIGQDCQAEVQGLWKELIDEMTDDHCAPDNYCACCSVTVAGDGVRPSLTGGDDPGCPSGKKCCFGLTNISIDCSCDTPK